MPKRTKLPVRSLGSEVEDPTVQALSAWVADHRGIEADLLTYKLDESLQVQDEIDVPAAGGRFYETRLIASITAEARSPGPMPGAFRFAWCRRRPLLDRSTARALRYPAPRFEGDRG